LNTKRINTINELATANIRSR